MGKAKKIPSAKPSGRTTKAHARQKKGTLDSTPKTPSSNEVVVLDRRSSGERRTTEDRRKADLPVPAERRNLERRQKVSRRRQIDPTTCERNYSVEEVEFMTAIEGYKRTSGRMFPTCSEILEVLRGLGYEKRVKVDAAAVVPPIDSPVAAPMSDSCIA